MLEKLKAEILLFDDSLAVVGGFEVRKAGGGRHFLWGWYVEEGTGLSLVWREGRGCLGFLR